MNGRFKLGSILFGAAAALLVATVAPSQAAAQEQQASGRFKVLIPNFEPLEGAKKKFGEKAAEELAKMIDELPTHQPIERRELRTALRSFKIDEDDLNCVRARQLANQIQAEVVACGTYEPSGDGYEVNVSFYQTATSESFDPAMVVVAEGGEQEAARHFFGAFETLIQQQRYARFCGEYAQSQQWENAMQNCNQAIDLNPTGVPSRYTRGMVYMNLEQYQPALDDFQAVLEINPIHDNAMNAAGFVAAKLGDAELARSYYGDYLDLNPGSASVRMKVAYDLAQAGDPYGAMQLIEAGISLDAENIDLYEQLGNFAFAAASGALADTEQAADEPVNAEVATLYRKAIESYTRVFDVRGSEAAVGQIRNMIAAHVQLGETEQAIALGERAIGTHAEEAQVWSIYADALQKGGRLSDALAALDRVQEIDPAYGNVLARQGKWLIDEGRIEEAIPVLMRAVESGEQTADLVANMVFANAYQEGVQKQAFGHAITVLGQARDFPVGERMKVQLDFWLAYSLYKQGESVQKPQTVQSAQQALPMFQRAQQLFRASTAYAEQMNNLDIPKLIDASGTYIEIQEAIIKRGR